MSDELTIYISPDDDLTTVRERLEEISARRLTMVIPPQTQLRSHVAWKLLYARARELGKEVVIVSSDPQVRSVAHAVKFKVAYSLETPSATGKSRPGSRSARITSSGGARTRPSPPVSSRPSSAKDANDPRSAHSRRGTPNTRPPRTRPPEPEWHGDPQHRQQAEEPIIGGLGPLPFDASAKEYSQPYDFRIQATPSIHPLTDQIEEPDLLLEDYTQAQDIRSAAREGQKRFPEPDIAPDTRPEEAAIAPDTRPEEALRSSNPTQQPHTADDLFTNIEDSQPPHTEESGIVSLGIDTNEHVTHDIEDVEELPDSVVDNVVNSSIEYRGDRDDIVPPPSSKPITYIEAEQPADHEEQENFPSRTYGVPSRRRRSSNLSPTPPTPSATSTWQFEEDALPPIEERPIEPRSSAPLPPRMSGNRPPGKIPPDPGTNPIPRTSVGRGQQTQARSTARPAQQRPGLGATRPRTATRQHATRSTTRRKTPVGIIMAIVLLFAACLLVYYGPTANATVSIATQDYPKQVTLTAKVGQQAQNIQAQQLSKVFTTSGTGTATGSQLVGTNSAQGTVTFTYNGSNSHGIVIPSQSIVTTSGDNAIEFATTAEVLVPPNASLPVSVQAVKPGKDGNVDAGAITVTPNNTLNSIVQAQNPPIAVSDLKLSVFNEASTTGGGARPTPAVTDQDLSNVKNNLRQQLQGKINAWQQQLSSTGAVGTPQITDTLINPPNVNDIEANSTFSATIKVTATVLLVRTADLQKEALKQLNNAIKNDKSYAGETILTDINPAVTINQLKQTTADANSITFTFKATAKVGSRLITKEYVQQLMAGKPIPDAKSTLVNIHGVKTAEITVSPNFMPWITLWDGHIDVTIQPATRATHH